MRLYVHEVIEWQFLSKFQIAKACVLCFALVWNPCCGSCCRQLTWSVAIWLTSPTIEWLDSYCGSCNWWDVFCVCGAFGVCFHFVAKCECMWLCVIPSSCSCVDVTFVIFGEWPGALGVLSVRLLYLLVVDWPMDLFLLVMEETIGTEFQQPCFFWQNAWRV